MDINIILNEILVKLFRNVTMIEEQAVKETEGKNVTLNDMHVIEAIGRTGAKNMSTVAKSLAVTTGTLTIAVNSLVKKGYVNRERSEEDRRVVLISLTEKGRSAFDTHQIFHKEMIETVVEQLDEEEKRVLAKALKSLNGYFSAVQEKVKKTK